MICAFMLATSVELIIGLSCLWSGWVEQMNLMVGHRCPIIHRFNLEARVEVKNGQLKAIKGASISSQRHVQALMFEVGFYF